MNQFGMHPDDVLDFPVDWAAWLGTDTISASTWTVPDGITADSDTFDDTTTTVWLSAPTDGQSYVLTNTITTADGRTRNYRIEIRCRSSAT